MSALWTAAETLKATGGVLAGANNWTASGITIDSREVGKGDIFVALKGDRNGHDFVADAFTKGAVAAVVSERPPGAHSEMNLLSVPDTLEAMEQLGRYRRGQSRARICAVTGSVGKTGTKEALRACLSPSGATHAAVKSFNNHLGVPLTLARMPTDVGYGVFEIGMNHAGEITPLTGMVRPHVAIVTTVQPVHLEFFASVEGIADAKGEIFSGVEPGGTAIINGDNEYCDRLTGHARDAGIGDILLFGEGAEADLRLVSMDTAQGVSRVEADILGERLTFTIPMPGKHHVMNALAVLGAVKRLGADLSAAAAAYETLKAGQGRGAQGTITLPGGGVTLIDESYNANPASMAAALSTLGDLAPDAGARRIAVLGDMLELGPTGSEFHARLLDAIEAADVDLVFCSGPLMAHLWEALPDQRRGLYGASSADIAEAVAAEVRPGDVVTVKGSLGSKMKLIVDALRARDVSAAQGGNRTT